MSFRVWWERLTGWITTAVVLLVISVLYLGGWACIGLLLFQLGLWGIVATAMLIVVDVVLFFLAPEWGLRLFACLFFSSSIWQVWSAGLWWTIALTLPWLVVILFYFLIPRFARRQLKGYDDIGHDLIGASNVWRFYSFTYPAPDTLLAVLASGEFPKKTEHRAFNAPPERKHKPIDCTVFAPDRVGREQSGLLQVFLHAPNEQQQASADAVKSDPEAKERGHKSLVLDAPTGTVFAFDVEVEDFVFPERTDTLLWTGQPQAANFGFNVPKGCKWGQHNGTVRISIDRFPVGRISFQIEVVPDARKARTQPVGKGARHYRACFCSYSSLDRVEMLKRAQGLRATGLQTFIDVLTLRPGDIWNPQILAAIDASDLFVVIWSKNARDSKWVRKESRYALKLWKQRGWPDFVPIPVEGPPIASVPRGLKTRHFNDELLSLIRATKVEDQERERKRTEQ